ncbi:MAG TPA: hypothetical protein VL068_02710, partial [Microthrixaceae bacterium]|nr:hypothetical protein [Microthrixaceae bacterium]
SVAAVHRFTDMGIEPFLVASSLTGVVGQRLLRRICANCKIDYIPTANEIAVLDAQVGHQPERWVKGQGCNLCSHTGYRGRVGVYELLDVSDAIREMIVDRSSHHDMRAVAVEEGMRTMQAQAFELVVNGVTTIEDVVRSVYAPGIDVEGSAPLELPRGRSALSRGRSAVRKGADEVEDPSAQTMPEDSGPVEVDHLGGAVVEAPEVKAEGSGGSKPEPGSESSPSGAVSNDSRATRAKESQKSAPAGAHTEVGVSE